MPQQNNNIQNQAVVPMDIENNDMQNLLNVIEAEELGPRMDLEAEELGPRMDLDPPPNSSLIANVISDGNSSAIGGENL
jgi:hypothetical protein